MGFHSNKERDTKEITMKLEKKEKAIVHRVLALIAVLPLVLLIASCSKNKVTAPAAERKLTNAQTEDWMSEVKPVIREAVQSFTAQTPKDSSVGVLTVYSSAPALSLSIAEEMTAAFMQTNHFKPLTIKQVQEGARKAPVSFHYDIAEIISQDDILTIARSMKLHYAAIFELQGDETAYRISIILIGVETGDTKTHSVYKTK